MQVLITSSEKFQSLPLTCLGKHHRSGLAASILLNLLPFKQGHLGRSEGLAGPVDPGWPANSLCWGAIERFPPIRMLLQAGKCGEGQGGLPLSRLTPGEHAGTIADWR